MPISDATKERLFNALIAFLAALTTLIGVFVANWQTQARVKKSENLIQQTVVEEADKAAVATTAAVTDQPAEVAKEAIDQAKAEAEGAQ